jgi:hypothetical protein
MMQIAVTINGTGLLALLDTGSTHNFINTDKAAKVGIVLSGVRGSCVVVTNGDRLTTLGCCHAVLMSVHGELFHIDYYGLTLGSYDMVLIVQWLEALGPILWDFSRDMLAFICNGRRVIWTASLANSMALLATDDELMEALLQDFSPLFREPLGLPLPRSHAHQIHQIPGTVSVAMRP